MPFTKGHPLYPYKDKSQYGKSRLGTKHSAETRKKMSLAHTGKKMSIEARKNISLGHLGVNSGNKAYQWKGDQVGYNALHTWVRKHLGTPNTCEHCGRTGLKGRSIHWANKSKKYLRKLDDWIRLCTPCHSAFDRV